MTNLNEPKQKLLSVIIPITRMTGKLENLEKTFSECRRGEVEFILVHDEQDSTTQNEIKGLITKFENLDIRLFRETFNSPGLARNFGALKSTAKWFCFSDSDDLPQIDNLVKATVRADENDADIAIGNILVIDDKKEMFIKSKILEGRSIGDITSFAISPAFTRFVFKSEIFKAVDFPALKMGEDQVYLGKTRFLDHKICLSDELLYIYFTNISNQATKNASSLSELPFAIEMLRQKLPDGSPQMNLYIQAQIIKMSITCLKQRINLRYAIKSILTQILSNPMQSIYMMFIILRVTYDTKK